jgi:hypothetical protein
MARTNMAVGRQDAGSDGGVHWAAPRVLAGVLLVVSAFWLVTSLVDPGFASRGGVDFAIYRDAALRWTMGGPFYYPEQLTGPYETISGHVMYPPSALLLFVPFTIVPAVFWWAVPLLIIGWRVLALRPSPWGWAGIAACLAWPVTIELVHTGNPVIWVAAAMSLATRWPWMSVFVLAKPSLFPFALAGADKRAWWAALGVSALISAPFMPMWFDWVQVVLNARGPISGPLYSLKDVPLMLIPLVAWWARKREK